MRAVIQRVSTATVTADRHSASIETGLMVLVGVERGDGPDDVAYIARKIRELRLFGGGSTTEFDRSVRDLP